jgi:hypothetical protein
MVIRGGRRASLPKKPERLAEIQAQARDAGAAALTASARADLQFRKWKAIEAFLVETPFHVSEAAPRGEQWRRVLRFVRTVIGEEELEDWVREQAEIADNLAAGIRDLRPRKGGSCHRVLLIYVRDKARKAAAVRDWALGAEETSSADASALPGMAVAPCFQRRGE